MSQKPSFCLVTPLEYLIRCRAVYCLAHQPPALYSVFIVWLSYSPTSCFFIRLFLFVSLSRFFSPSFLVLFFSLRTVWLCKTSLCVWGRSMACSPVLCSPGPCQSGNCWVLFSANLSRAADNEQPIENCDKRITEHLFREKGYVWRVENFPDLVKTWIVQVLALTAGRTVPFLTTWLSAEPLLGSGL